MVHSLFTVNMKIYLLIQFVALFAGAWATDPPKWDPTFNVKGVLYIPYAEIAEPFEAWFDKASGRSRIDYYDGTVKTYQLKHEYDYGTSLKVAPVSTNDVLNKVTCLQVNGTADQPVDIQSILPDAKEFQLAGTENKLGLKCDKFVFEESIGQKSNKYTLWVRYKKSPKYPASRMPIPVRYEMKGFNSLLGSHYDHYYLDYDSYSHEEIPNEIFEVDLAEPCIGFPGPGNGHYATFNPMKEFIHPADNSHVDFEFQKFINKHDVNYDNETDIAIQKFMIKHGVNYDNETDFDIRQFMTKHDIKYNNESRTSFRQLIFSYNLRFINSKNRADLGFSLGINHLADRTDDELAALRGFRPSGVKNNGGQPFPYDTKSGSKDIDSLPNQYDWRLYGAVTPVKDQSVCGSCWSFGTIGAIEGAYFLKNGNNLVRLSQQALIDCSWGYGNNGCDGGEDFRAYQWMMKVGGVPTEEAYGGYLGQDGYCHIDKVPLVAPITGWVNVTQNDHEALKLAIIKHGPISVAIDASHKTLSFYSHGVYFEPKCGNKEDDMDHAVLAVGYGVINGELYWLIKNSWSTYWGNDGYILMSARDNNCGVMTTPTYVTM